VIGATRKLLGVAGFEPATPLVPNEVCYQPVTIDHDRQVLFSRLSETTAGQRRQQRRSSLRFLLILARQQRHDQASAVIPTNYGEKVVTQILKFDGVPFRVSLWRPFARQREPVL
jgi:hypothetical protein